MTDIRISHRPRGVAIVWSPDCTYSYSILRHLDNGETVYFVHRTGGGRSTVVIGFGGPRGAKLAVDHARHCLRWRLHYEPACQACQCHPCRCDVLYG